MSSFLTGICLCFNPNSHLLSSYFVTFSTSVRMAYCDLCTVATISYMCEANLSYCGLNNTQIFRNIFSLFQLYESFLQSYESASQELHTFHACIYRKGHL